MASKNNGTSPSPLLPYSSLLRDDAHGCERVGHSEAVDELLGEESGDGDHGHAAVLDFLGRHGGELRGVGGLEAERVEANVAGIVALLEGTHGASVVGSARRRTSE